MKNNNLFRDEGCDLDTTKPFMRAVVFKQSGKWYTSEFSYICDEHLEIIDAYRGFILLDLIKEKHEEVKKYCSMTFDTKVVFEAYNVDGFFLTLG